MNVESFKEKLEMKTGTGWTIFIQSNKPLEDVFPPELQKFIHIGEDGTISIREYNIDEFDNFLIDPYIEKLINLFKNLNIEHFLRNEKIYVEELSEYGFEVEKYTSEDIDKKIVTDPKGLYNYLSNIFPDEYPETQLQISHKMILYLNKLSKKFDPEVSWLLRRDKFLITEDKVSEKFLTNVLESIPYEVKNKVKDEHLIIYHNKNLYKQLWFDYFNISDEDREMMINLDKYFKILFDGEDIDVGNMIVKDGNLSYPNFNIDALHDGTLEQNLPQGLIDLIIFKNDLIKYEGLVIFLKEYLPLFLDYYTEDFPLFYPKNFETRAEHYLEKTLSEEDISYDANKHGKYTLNISADSKDVRRILKIINKIFY